MRVIRSEEAARRIDEIVVIEGDPRSSPGNGSRLRNLPALGSR